MDFDNDIDGSPSTLIGTFLIKKLNAIKEANARLASTITEIDGALNSIINDSNSTSKASRLSVANTSVKFYNGRWCFIIEVHQNEENKEEIVHENFSFIGKWSPLIAPRHTLMTFSCANGIGRQDFVQAATPTRTTARVYVLVAFEDISFAAHSTFECDATLFYYEAGADALPLPLPKLTASLDALCQSLHEIRTADMTSRADALLAAIACSERVDVVMHLAANSSLSNSLENYLIIDCMFQEVCAIDAGDKRYLLDSHVSALNHGIVQVGSQSRVSNIYDCVVYVRDKKHFHCLLHYMKSKIAGLTVVLQQDKKSLEKLKQQEHKAYIFKSQDTLQSQEPAAVDNEVREFAEIMLKQVEETLTFYNNIANNPVMSRDCNITSEYYRTMNALIDYEYKSDLLHDRITSKLN